MIISLYTREKTVHNKIPLPTVIKITLFKGKVCEHKKIPLTNMKKITLWKYLEPL